MWIVSSNSKKRNDRILTDFYHKGDKAMKKLITVTEFKNNIFSYIKDVETKNDEIVIVSRDGTPRIRIQSIKEPMLGAMKGLMEVHCDLTEPACDDWEASLYNK